MKHQTTLEKSLYQPPPEREEFCTAVIKLLAKSEIPFLLSGSYALAAHTGIVRPTKDVDVFATAGDCLKILSQFKGLEYDVEIVDVRWLARITRGEIFVDVIFNMPTVSTRSTASTISQRFSTAMRITPATKARQCAARPSTMPRSSCFVTHLVRPTW